ncbi:MAG: hypothetical protein NTZ05_07105 [Chloroflexi bacterium]|nr:hypothetical protein [Chloroflexota bacterium]
MAIKHFPISCDEDERRAEARDTILQYGREIGWPSRMTVMFTEKLTRRPWKRCTLGQLWTVLDQMDAILRACMAPHPGRINLFDAGVLPSHKEPRYAYRD